MENNEQPRYKLHHVNRRTGEKIPFKDHPRLDGLPKETLEDLAAKVNEGSKPYGPDWEAQVLKLAKKPDDRGYKGWMAPDGTFHSNEGNLYPGNTHYNTLARLGLDGLDHLDYSKAYDAGYGHVADDMMFGDETGSSIHLHHPQLRYTSAQLETLKRLAKREGVGASVTTRVNGKPGTRKLKLADPNQSSVIVRVPLPTPVTQQPQRSNPQPQTIRKTYVW